MYADELRPSAPDFCRVHFAISHYKRFQNLEPAAASRAPRFGEPRHIQAGGKPQER